LHIVSFDVPFPPNYGGVMDVFYKLVWLKQAGVRVHLHCFTYGREPSPELEKYCEKVYYYKRKTGLLSNFSYLPYTVRSRQSDELKSNLLQNNWPILFEVLHTCYLMSDPAFNDRQLIYRHSNIEHHYYIGLAKTERNFLKRLYLRIEALKLKAFEKTVAKANLILAVNRNDRDYFRRKYPEVRSEFIPSFHPGKVLDPAQPVGNYILFHGNLGISENYEAAKWLVEGVFSKINQSVIIAGLNPPEKLKQQVARFPNITLLENPDATKMDELICGAKLHVLYTSQGTGLKLKLLNVLFRGRFLLCNPAMLEGTGLKANNGIHIAIKAEEFITQINGIMKEDFDEACFVEREVAIREFENAANASRLRDLVFSKTLTPIP
jgi:glycosyltransferase involved in cell wall biosynthesis